MAIETELAAPALLIAVPQLGDPSFRRGVVFILEHGEEGSMGLVLNRPSELPMREFCASQKLSFHGDGAARICRGGPVQTDRAFILHSSAHRGPETETVLGAISLSYSMESLRLIVADPPTQLRVFLGYAGWAPGQLAEEVSAGAWITGSPTPPLVFETPHDEVWEAALREQGIEAVQLMHSGAIN